MTAETDRMEAEARQMLKEISRRRSAVAKLRKVVRNGDLIKHPVIPPFGGIIDDRCLS